MHTRMMRRALSTTAPSKVIAVFGGNGYLGSRIVECAVANGIHVVSINRSGKPSYVKKESSLITWKKGDIFNENDWKDDIAAVDGVISCVGAFGSNEFMLKINGDANIHAISQSLRAGVPRFVYVSTVENNLPDALLKGYFDGKRNAEQALLDAFPAPAAGVVLRPGFIYGTREVPLPSGGTLPLPLGLLGQPLSLLLQLGIFDQLRTKIPGMLAVLAPPLPVESVAKVAVAAAVGDDPAVLQACTDPSSGRPNVLSVADIANVVELTALK